MSELVTPENNLLQHYVYDTEKFAADNNLVIDKNKTKVVAFTKSRKWDFPPELEFSDGTRIETISETKLVGVVISQALKWHKNTQYICDKAGQRLWVL